MLYCWLSAGKTRWMLRSHFRALSIGLTINATCMHRVGQNLLGALSSVYHLSRWKETDLTDEAPSWHQSKIGWVFFPGLSDSYGVERESYQPQGGKGHTWCLNAFFPRFYQCRLWCPYHAPEFPQNLPPPSFQPQTLHSSVLAEGEVRLPGSVQSGEKHERIALPNFCAITYSMFYIANC